MKGGDAENRTCLVLSDLIVLSKFQTCIRSHNLLPLLHVRVVWAVISKMFVQIKGHWALAFIAIRSRLLEQIYLIAGTSIQI